MSSDMNSEQLVGIYLNKAGKVNSQFTRQMRKVSEEVRNATIALIKLRGLPPYEFRTHPRKPKTRKIIRFVPEQAQKPVITSDMIQELLVEVRKERTSIADRLKTLDIVERYYLDKLRSLGVCRVMHAASNEDGLVEILDQTDYDEAHKHSKNNSSEVVRSGKCGCFYCCEIFVSSDVNKWADNGRTAICPKCGVDAVICDRSGYVFSEQFLQGMHDRWFNEKDSGVGRCDTSTENQSAGPAVSATARAAHDPV